MRFELCPAPLNTPAGRLPLPFSHRLGRGGWRSAWLALYNLHGKTREVIPWRDAARLVCGSQCSSLRSSRIIIPHQQSLHLCLQLDTQSEYKTVSSVVSSALINEAKVK